MKISISQSEIKDILYTGEYGDACWKRYKALSTDRSISVPSEPMLKGNYFEVITGVNIKPVSLPLLKNGKPSVDQLRLEQQALIFKKIVAERKMTVSNDNTQVKIECPYGDYYCPECKSTNVSVKPNIYNNPVWEGICADCGHNSNGLDFTDVTLRGTMDILSPFIKKENGKDILLPLANIDTKVTGSINNTYGSNQWGNISEKNFLQAIFYHYIFYRITGKHLHHVFIVFDIKPKMEHKIVYKEVNSFELKSVENDINMMIHNIKEAADNDWPISPNNDNCRYCPLGNNYNDYLNKAYGDGTCKHYNLFKEQTI